ncbi:MAG: prephenate dehydratase [Candidatus Dormibacteraceae bacterium]
MTAPPAGPGPTKVAYQGEPGAYSEEAVLVLFPDAEPVGVRSFADAASALEGGSVAKAVLPVENSLAGIVQEVNDLLWERTLVTVTMEYAHPVRHCLLGRGGPVERAASHPQALGQCRRWLEAHGIEAIPFYDTAGAARWVAEGAPPGTAAIAGRAAARHYGLEVLAGDIQDQASNRTRFLLLQRRDGADPGAPWAAARNGWKASLAFSAAHVPGSLALALEPFSKRGVNLTRLDSRPIPERPFNYLFYLDFQVEDPGAAQDCLDDLRKRAVEVRLFGVYPVRGSD